MDLEKKNLEGRSPMSRTSRTMSSRSKDRVQQIVNQVLNDLNEVLDVWNLEDKVFEPDEVLEVQDVEDEVGQGL